MKPATERAIDAYCRLFGSCRRYGGNFPVPSTHKTKQVGDIVEVRNRIGLLATYKVMPSGQVIRMMVSDDVVNHVVDSFPEQELIRAANDLGLGQGRKPVHSWQREGF